MLKGKTAIITGGASGIGAACVMKFAREGAIVVIADVNDEDGRKLVEAITNNGGTAGYIHVDVTIPVDVERMTKDTLDKYGRIDILLNNVGINPTGNVLKTPIDVWDRVMSINLRSVFLGCKNVIPAMIRNGGGTIINMGSVSGLEAGPVSQAAYETSKAGIIALTKSVAQDFASENVRVNCICPGAVATPLIKKFVEESMNPEEKQAWLGIVPMGRLGEPREIAAVAAFLASDEASYMTGAAIVVDGGRTAGINKPN